MWQATCGPCMRTLKRSASESQSAAHSTTVITLPLVSPLCQYSLRLRLQKTISPHSCVRRRASSFIQAIISTSPLSASWTIAGASFSPPNSTSNLISLMSSSNFISRLSSIAAWFGKLTNLSGVLSSNHAPVRCRGAPTCKCRGFRHPSGRERAVCR